ncbi:unnamed protein product [Phytophthora fragariaefolia]|uniref:Unnamed protein product n=1 Tax=Phytophthora fragariaefolia TaxID=1490495 RepID=A0A9W7CRY3_9STRA|nr:unnamed protein product [Phytophthora fragariaefolia]
MKGGNKSVNDIYSKHLDKWIEVDASLELLPNTATDVREKCIRAKYEDKRFTKLPHFFAPRDEKNQDSPENPEEPAASTTSGGIAEPSLSSTQRASADQSQQRRSGQNAQNGEPTVVKPGSVIEVTKRFLNYFVVVGRGALVPDQNIEKTKSPTEIRFLPAVLDMFPEMYGDAPLPTHIGDFAFPEGFVLSKTYVVPVFFSFVLTNVSGVKIYACALKFYEELHPLEVVSLIAPHYHRQRHRRRPSNGPHQADENDDNQRTQLPQWVQDLSGDVSSAPGPAPVPFLVGTHSDCLKQVAGRTTNVVFVDLDHNRYDCVSFFEATYFLVTIELYSVIPAVDESGKIIPIPKIPDREGSKLRAKLAEVASTADTTKPIISQLKGPRFVQDNFDTASRPFVTQLVATQMFDRFIEDRVFNQQLPEVKFFDQSINQKLNRSLTIGKKKYDCSFLEDRSDEIQETFIAPPPSNIGLPDDGSVYKVSRLVPICFKRLNV